MPSADFPLLRAKYSQNFGQLHEKGPNAETPGPWCDNTPTRTIVISAARLMADQQSNSVYS